MREVAKDARRAVLVVDNDEPILLALAEVLRDAGYEAAIAASGEEAIDLLRHRRVDAVLLDLVMPEMDGWAVAAQIRAEPDLGHLPIVVMTAHGTRTLATAPVAAGYLTKPIAVDALLAILRRTLELRSRSPEDHRSSGIRRVDGRGAVTGTSIPPARDSEPGAMSS